MNANLFALFASHFPQDLTGSALETADGLDYSWDDLDRATARIANLLASLALPPGSRIVAHVDKSPEAMLLYLATLRAGHVYVPLNIAYQEAEIAYFVGDAQPAVVICSSRNFGWISRLAFCGGTQSVFTLDDDRTGSLLNRASAHADTFDAAQCDADSLASIIYTSGTTGRSKGAMLSHGNLAANAQVLHDYWQWQPGDVLLHALPIFHVHGLFVALHAALLNGSKMIWLNHFDVSDIVKHLPRCTVLMGVPTFYVRLLADRRFDRDVCRRMRLFISGSAPLLTETFEAFREHTGHTILERYGMSETVMLTSNPCDPELGPRWAGTVGRALPGVGVRVVNEVGQPCGPGAVGEIQVNGPSIFLGYWRMPDKTREEFTTDGWFKTGDVGRWGGESGGQRAPDDVLSIVGRSKDLIITGGYNVYPKEIETVIDDFPGVAESAVVGVPHPDFGEAVVAVVVARTDASLQEVEMIATLKRRIAGYKVPKRVMMVAELPRNAMGKVQKAQLRKQYAALF